MRLFGIESDGRFREYFTKPFQAGHEERVLEGWLESNPDGIVEDGNLLIIGRQVGTNLGSVIDLLALDREGDVVVVELKRDRTPRETLAQALEYASFVENLGSDELQGILASYLHDESLNLAEYHRQYFGLATDEAVAFNKDQRIVIIGQRVTDEIRQTSRFLRGKGIRVTCLEFSFFEAAGGLKLLSHEIVVGDEPAKPERLTTASLPVTSPEEFLDSLDPNGRPVFERVLSFAKQRALPIHWGTKGFSLNVDLGGIHVAVCYGYPPHAVYRQSIYTALYGRGGLLTKVAAPAEVLQELYSTAQTTGLFAPAGREQRCGIDRPFSDSEIARLTDWIQSAVDTVRRYGLKGADSGEAHDS